MAGRKKPAKEAKAKITIEYLKRGVRESFEEIEAAQKNLAAKIEKLERMLRERTFFKKTS